MVTLIRMHNPASLQSDDDVSECEDEYMNMMTFNRF